MLTLVCKAIWTFLMIIFEVYERMHYILKLCRLKIMNIIYFGSYKQDNHFLKQCQSDLNKIPKHLSIIIGLETVDTKVLSKIAVYALMSNIKYISYYDIKDEFSLDQIHIPNFIYSKKIQSNKLLWSMPGEKKEINHKNGLDKSLEIINLSPNAGKQLIVEVCKTLCANKESSELKEALKTKSCLTEKINEIFQKRLNYLPDPDLAIIFNKTMCTYGLLPWQTGFTEFHNIDVKHYFDVQMFANVLYKFSKCEQRFGK